MPALAGVAKAHGLSASPIAASGPGPAKTCVFPHPPATGAGEPVACADAVAKLAAGDWVAARVGVLGGVGEVVVGDAQAANARLSNPTMIPLMACRRYTAARGSSRAEGIGAAYPT